VTAERKDPSSRAGKPTSHYVRRACAGDAKSVAWLVERFAPPLFAQAAYRLRGVPSSIYSAEDLVQDVWVTALPRLRDLSARDSQLTPVLMRFLSTTLLNRSNTLLQKHIRGKPLRVSVSDAQSELIDQASAVVTQTLRSEACDALRAAIDALSPRDRAIVVLRGIEQNQNETVAKLLKLRPNTVAVQYHRALARLRARLRDSVFDELD
jgi:RNA polymerase sigma factor (sigma-70 family)